MDLMDIILAKKLGGGGGVSSWNDLTDKPEGMGYIEKGGMVEILPECQPAFVEESGAFVATPTNSPVAGVPCTVNWNGTEYVCVAQDLSAMMPGAVLLGDGTNLGTSGNGEPFMIVIGEEGGNVFCMSMALDGSTELTLSIYSEKITAHKMDSRCLPDEVCTDVLIVRATEKNNGTPTAVSHTGAEIFKSVRLGNKIAFFSYNGSVIPLTGVGESGIAKFEQLTFSVIGSDGEGNPLTALQRTRVVIEADGSVSEYIQGENIQLN